MLTKSHTDISKFLSFVLRHEPHAIGISLDDQGWTDINRLIEAAAQAGWSLDQKLVQSIVDSSEKKRFAISNDGKSIRALQGHSTRAVAVQYALTVPPLVLYHGTATRFLEAIQREGLKPGQRHQVHLSQDLVTAMRVGKRHGSPIGLKVEALRMYESGFHFYRADNGIWLTASVPWDFISI